MIASSGFFKNIVCPYFRVGLCERPNCLYSHEKPAASDLLNVPTTSKYTTNDEAVYVPTPLAELKASKRDKKKKPIDAPIYEPTPISELRQGKVEKEVNKRKSSTGESSSDGDIVEKTKRVKIQSIEVDIFAVTNKKSKSKESHKKEKSPIKVRKKSTSDESDGVPTDDVIAVEDEEEIEPVKKRIAHSVEVKRPQQVINNKMTAKEMMMQRFQTKANKPLETQLTPSSTDLKAPNKRVAHSFNKSPNKSTNASAAKRPTIPLDFVSSSKVPLPMRKKTLDRLIDEFLKFCDEPTSYDRALKEEKSIYERIKSKTSYPTVTASAILKIREEAKSSPNAPLSPSKAPHHTVSHEKMLNGPHFVNCGFTQRKKTIDLLDLPESYIYDFLKKFLMSEDDLKTYGYPFPDPMVPGKAILPKAENCLNDFKALVRTCSRCKKIFKVTEEGFPINKKEGCVFHSGRIWTDKNRGTFLKIHSCCKQEVPAGGCCSSDFHVVDGSGHPEYEYGFVQTKSKKTSSKSPGIYALDCEMCNTTIGMELTRVSVVDVHSKSVFESLVKPKNPILDYNTKFSGIKKGDLDNVTTTIEDIQEKLLNLFNDKTILIGHSLESDFKALKLIHMTVIDTAQVFPHRRGLPFKRALRTIVGEICHKIIQEDVGGHDSIEDASSCMKLMVMKATDVMHKFKNQPILQEAVEEERKRRKELNV